MEEFQSMEKGIRNIGLFLLLCFGVQAAAQDVYFSDGYAFFKQEDYINAVKSFNLALAAGENSELIHKFRGMAKQQLNDWKGAERDLKAHVAANPTQAKNYLPLAKLYFEIGSHEKSIRQLDRAIELDPYLAVAYNLRGMNFQALSQSFDRDKDYFQKAFTDFTKAITIDSTFAWAYNNRGAARFYNQDVDDPSTRDIERALEDFQKALYYKPDLPKVLRNSGMAKAMLDNYDEAYKEIGRAIWLAPEDAENYLIRARVHFRKGDYVRAIRDYERTIELNDLLVDAYLELGKSWLEHGKPSDAIGYLTLSVDVDPSKAHVATYQIARCYAKMNDKPQMLAFLEKARKKGYFNRKNFKKFFADSIFDDFRKDPDFNTSVQKIRKTIS